MYHCYVLSPFCRSSRAVQYGVQKIICERAQIMYNFDLFANGLLNTKFSEVCSFSLQLAHDESFNFVHELTQANLKQGISRYRKNKSVVPFHFSIKVFKFTQLCINSRTDKLYTSENCRTLTVLKKKGLPLELVNSFLITDSSQQCFSLISFMMFSAFFNRFVIVSSCVVWRSRSLSEMG